MEDEHEVKWVLEKIEEPRSAKVPYVARYGEQVSGKSDVARFSISADSHEEAEEKARNILAVLNSPAKREIPTAVMAKI